MLKLQLINPDGYDVPGSHRIVNYYAEAPAAKTELLTTEASRDAGRWNNYDVRNYTVAERPAPQRPATVADIVTRLTSSPYEWTAVDALGWGMGLAQLNIADAVAAAENKGWVITRTEHGKTFVQLAPMYTLTYETEQGPQRRESRPARAVETIGRLLSRMADRDEAWNIAVLDGQGRDVTDEFACFQD